MTLLLPPPPAVPGLPAGRRPRVALYGHDTVGLGHLRRNLALAEHLGEGLAAAGGADVLLVTASAEAGRFPLPGGVELLVLPSVRKDAAGGYAPGSWQAGLDDVVALRRRLLSAALEGFAPDLLVVDKCPWGLRGELEPALHLLRERGTRLVLGLRDVLDDPAVASRQWREDRGDDAVRSCYDEVWVYGDRHVHDVADAAAMAPVSADACRYLGYLSAGRLTGAAAPTGPEGADLPALARARVTPTVEVRLDGDLTRLALPVDTALYRLAQESLTNALRHARGATRVLVEVCRERDAVRLRVSDDGRAVPGPGPEPGFGLLGMAERAQLLGGSLTAGPGPDPDVGWVVEAVLPVRAAEPTA